MMDNLPGNTERKICLCLSVTDCEIATAFAAGHRTLNDIRATTRACTRCFGCESDLTSFIDDVLIPGKYVPPNQGLRNRAMLLARRLQLYRLAQRYYHRHVRWRMQPMVFASAVVERTDLHSRVVIANVNRDEQGQSSALSISRDSCSIRGAPWCTTGSIMLTSTRRSSSRAGR